VRVRRTTTKLTDAPTAPRPVPGTPTGPTPRNYETSRAPSGPPPRPTKSRASRAPVYWALGVVAIVCVIVIVATGLAKRDRSRGEVEVADRGRPSVEAPNSTWTPTTPLDPSGTTAEVLAKLGVAGERPAGYERSKFEHWVDDDGDGCDTRDEVLIAESEVRVDVTGSCQISGGRWFSIYDGSIVSSPGELDIDHMVPLKEAWDSGADEWSSNRRREFANDLSDPRSLRGVTASSNRSKSDQDPADWLPSNDAAICDYLDDWVNIKAKWSLRVDLRERNAISATLEKHCV
jgi:hypothetical protein